MWEVSRLVEEETIRPRSSKPPLPEVTKVFLDRSGEVLSTEEISAITGRSLEEIRRAVRRLRLISRHIRQIDAEHHSYEVSRPSLVDDFQQL